MDDLQINKGVELMLRRRAKAPSPPSERGIKINHSLALLKKVFQFKIEFTWREESTT
jgi:hypothetical protein|tara:strand:- start:659 stop:829 length:171 start_codon:yes stop_codon:yes gene_type:complete